MATKLYRGKKNLFRRRNTGRLKAVLTVLVCVALVGAGVLLAKLVSGAPEQPDKTEQTTTSTVSTTTATTTVTTTAPPDSTVTDRRSLYVTTAQLRDTAALETLLTAAAAKGYNGVVFDLKDADGVVWYTAETELAVKAGAVSAEALTKEELKALAELCRAQKMEPIPRVFAFRDKTAPFKLTDARVKLAGNGNITWLDRKKSEGGKPWLNPCSEVAWDYVLGLCAELKELGFTEQILDGVQFPEKDSRSDYGDGPLAQKEKHEVLAAFAEEAQKTLGDGLLIAVSGTAALGSDTAGYHGNPLSFGMTAVAPRLTATELTGTLTFDGETVDAAADPAGAVRLALQQMASYSRIMELSVTVVPWVDSPAAVKVAKAQKHASYILYNETGTYDF